jgi:hypothetical protein
LNLSAAAGLNLKLETNNKKTAPPKSKRMERSTGTPAGLPVWGTPARVAVSPFDGVNRIRFKGSPTHCRFAIVDCRLNSSLQIGNWKLAISNDPGLSASIHVDSGSPETLFGFQTVGEILELQGLNCN